MPTQQNTGEFLEGAFELAFGEMSETALSGMEPSVALATAIALSPEAGGIVASQPQVAIATAVAISPDVAGGIVVSLPEVAIAIAVAISPTVIFTPGLAVLGIFGVEASTEADDWDMEPTYVADEFEAGVPV